MTTPPQPEVVGLGDIGLPMAEALLRSGIGVAAYDRRPDALDATALAAARPITGLAELGATCGVVCVASSTQRSSRP